MLRSKIRFASMTAVVLFALGAVCTSISPVPTEAQQPARPEDKESKVKELQLARLATARELAKLQSARFRNNHGHVEEVLEATRALAESELDLCASDKERVAALEKSLAVAKYTERIAANFHKVGQGRESSALMAKTERLRIAIALEQAKAKKALPQEGGGNSEPNAKVKKGDQQKATTQPATIQAYESVRLFARASGFLKKQTVDIGDRVKRGDVLAVVDVPELEAQLRHDSAFLERERSRVDQAKNLIRGVEADLETAKLAVKQAEANAKSAVVWTQYREKVWKRMKELHDAKGIEERLVDEAKERYDAARETEQSAKAAVATAKARVIAGEVKIEQAKADIVVAQADVNVAQTKVEKTQVLLSFATITAPFDGVVIHRENVPGDFIQSAENGKKAEPLLAVQRTDLYRAIVSVSERDVPFIERGDAVNLTLDAFPGRKWSAKVSRVAGYLDAKTGGMRVEIDVPNSNGQIYPGMSGRATIVFGKSKE